jgi:hypothetical protein
MNDFLTDRFGNRDPLSYTDFFKKMFVKQHEKKIIC